MTTSIDISPQNEDVYDELVTVIENSVGTFAPIIAVCEDRRLRERIIQRYEEELSPQFRTYRLKLNTQEPSLRAALAEWATQPNAPKAGEPTVITVTGTEELLWLNLQADSTEKSELDKFFGYLQWTREGLREFPYPIVLWVTSRTMKLMSRQAPDFWSWRRGIYRFNSDPVVVSESNHSIADLPRSQASQPSSFLLPLADLQAQITQLEAQDPQAPGLATLYDRIGQVYADRISKGEANNVEQESALAIDYFKKAIALQTNRKLDFAQMYSLNRLGVFYESQGNYLQASDAHQQSLEIARQFGDRQAESAALSNLGIVYLALGKHNLAVKLFEQDLALTHEMTDSQGEAVALGHLGSIYRIMGDTQRAIDSYRKALDISRKIENRSVERTVLGNLGNVYASMGDYQQAIDFQRQALNISHEIKNRKGEANALGNLGVIYFRLKKYREAKDSYQKQINISRQIGDRRGEGIASGNLGEVSLKLKQYSEAQAWLQASLQISREIGDRTTEAEALKNLAELYYKTRQSQLAQEYCKQAIALATELGIPLLKDCEALKKEIEQTEKNNSSNDDLPQSSAQ